MSKDSCNLFGESVGVGLACAHSRCLSAVKLTHDTTQKLLALAAVHTYVRCGVREGACIP